MLRPVGARSHSPCAAFRTETRARRGRSEAAGAGPSRRGGVRGVEAGENADALALPARAGGRGPSAVARDKPLAVSSVPPPTRRDPPPRASDRRWSGSSAVSRVSSRGRSRLRPRSGRGGVWCRWRGEPGLRGGRGEDEGVGAPEEGRGVDEPSAESGRRRRRGTRKGGWWVAPQERPSGTGGRSRGVSPGLSSARNLPLLSACLGPCRSLPCPCLCVSVSLSRSLCAPTPVSAPVSVSVSFPRMRKKGILVEDPQRLPLRVHSLL